MIVMLDHMNKTDRQMGRMTVIFDHMRETDRLAG